MGVFISCLAEYTTGIKKKKSERQKKKREMKDRHAGTPLMSKQKCLNDLLGERECRI